MKDFIINCIERTGGIIEEIEPDLLSAILPDEIAQAASSETIVTLALTQEAAEKRRDATLALIGTPLMDTLIEFASNIGTSSRSQIHLNNVRRKGLKEEAEKQLIYSRCRVRNDETALPTLRDCYYAVFNFRVTFVSFEKRERIERIAVAIDTESVNNIFSDALQNIPFESVSLSSAASKPFDDGGKIQAAYEVAKKEAARRAEKDGEAYLTAISKRFQIEANRLAEYYDQTDRELKRRLDKEADQTKRGAIQSKIDAAKLEKTRKLSELGEKYRLRPRASLTSINIVSQPKTYFNLYVDKGKQTRTVTLIYDSLINRLEPPLCDSCRQEMVRITVTDAGKHLCPECEGK